MMDESTSGYVRGVITRVGNLSVSGRLDDAERALALVRPLLASDPQPDTRHAQTWTRARLIEARLLIRRGGLDRLERARTIINDLERRVPLNDPPRDSPGGSLLTGNQRLVFYSGLSITIGRLGRHLDAAQIAERIADRSRGDSSRLHLSLFNAASRYDTEAFSQMCQDARPIARARLRTALRLIEETLADNGMHLPEGPQRDASLDARRSIRFRIVCHQLELDRRDAVDADDNEGVDRARSQLLRLRGEVEELLDRSATNLTTTPTELANRHGRLGDVLLALARCASDSTERAALAHAARIWTLPRWTLSSQTSDASALLRLEYAECCELGGDLPGARDVLRRAVAELGERCTPDYPPVQLARERLERLEAS